MATINIRVDEKIKKEAENLYKEIGLNMSTAINLFLKKCILEQGIPFDLKVPNKETIEVMKEAKEIANDKNRTRYNNIQDLKKALEV